MKYLEGFPRIYEKTILVNDTGYYFDFVLNDIDKKHFSDIDNLKTDVLQIISYPSYQKIFKTDVLQIISYPSYQKIFKNLEKIKNSSCIILLHKTQKKEISLLSSYFRVKYLDFDLHVFFRFIKSSFINEEEIKKLAETSQFYKLLYIFLKLREELRLNPSQFKDMGTYKAVFNRNDFLNMDKYPKTNKYLKKAFDIDVFLYLLYHEITGYNDEKTQFIVSLTQQENLSRIPFSDIKHFNPDVLEHFKREGIVYLAEDVVGFV